jgi:glyoxylase-like metal-dependent hydrolase (beta-lactamase superfamily II)
LTLLPILRRAQRSALLGVLVLCGVVASIAQDQPNVVRVQSLGVSDNLYLLSGGGGNSLALVTDVGVVLVDTKLTGWGRAMLAAVQAVTHLPVTTIINTHTHGDHTGGNAELPTATRVIAHENTKTHMRTMTAFSGAGERALPNSTFTDRLSLLDGIDRIDLYYFGAGHTNGDAVVVFPAKGVAHMGDLFPSKATPLIDTAHGGSGVAYPDTLDKAVGALDGIVTRVVTGHDSPPPGSPIKAMSGMQDLKDYAAFNREFLAAVRVAAAAGRSAQEAAATLGLPDRFKDYTMNRAAENVAAIYRELR